MEYIRLFSSCKNYYIKALVLHIIPIHYFDNNYFFKSDDFKNFQLQEFQPMSIFEGRPSFSKKVNLDGYVFYESLIEVKKFYCYTQIFRNTTIEAVNLNCFDNQKKLLLNYKFNVIEVLKLYCSSLSKRSVNGPYVIYLSFLDINNYRICPERNPSSSIRENLLLIPDMYVNNINDSNIETIMKPTFDMVSNAFGVFE